MNVYWETPEDHLTVFKTSPEHALILEAGAYDVSARLLEGNLRVDDGWIGRKNPDIIVKAVSRKVLGTGVPSSAAARKVYTELLAREGWSALGAVKNGRILLLSEERLEAPHLRLAAALMVARTASPDLFADVSIGDALAMLGEEAAGTAPDGIFYYTGQGGF
jgi:ABC-type Fe3+-hydroxamate transport system substrate-binding protein